ncbi:tRNA 2-thiouridine(34) synthase MnmA [Caldinitratiruptor microaerophilus]|uniref:tRNA-specific 2-thiouridylase MnmA n=1 Tax=Caldinitratiruptor microaerophilus TaxID=671077 RepID=A0AA35CJY4_9FIRM|nr:tRNA 2-thiouridine(34) synthase MnmA [Caldinitratiruptor microaerophilus]BDG60587.1 tRNA-specific 2-thiouridylase MnmA [Caldinitratiruptor microaerophilus]
MAERKRVLVAMSGGVDSSVTAALLVEQGYEVIGVTMNTWTDDIPADVRLNEHSGCCSLAAVEDARRVADILGIPYYVFNFQGKFSETVIDYFIREYARGRTPNPCIACNRYVKFSALLYRARQLGCDLIATGHYARVGRDPETGRWLLGKARDTRKDQTYVLHNMTQEALSRTLFPLGDWLKPDVRRKAKEVGLPVHDKPDSQEICFVYDNDYGRFLSEKIPEAIRPGPIVTTDGRVIGTHKGLPLYTIGQRKGLPAMGEPIYVVDLDPDTNTLIVGRDEEVYRRELIAADLNWIRVAELTGPARATAKIRRMAPEAPCTVVPEGPDRVRVVFDEPQRALTPGQAVVFYQGEWVLGGGTIESVPAPAGAPRPAAAVRE